MRKSVLLILVATLLLLVSNFVPLSIPGAPVPQILAPIAKGNWDSSLVGWWPLNGTALDYSGKGAKGTWYGTQSGTSSTWYSAGTSQRLVGTFDGSTNYITLATDNYYSTPVFTLCARVTPSNVTTTQNVVGANGAYNTILLYAGISSGSKIKTYDGSSYRYGTTVLVANSTYLLCWQLSGATLNMNVNGDAWEYSGTAAWAAGAHLLSIGSFYGGGSGWFSGSIWDVRLYSKALSVADTAKLYAGGNP
jgi:hypothetical protein